MSEYNNPLISPSLTDLTETNRPLAKIRRSGKIGA